jgi:hypothetical protein
MKKIIFTTSAVSAVGILMITLGLSSCTDATMGKIGGYGNSFTVQVLGPDTIITYVSSGKVISEEHSDGYYFTDSKTGKLIEVSGTVIISEN